MPDLGNLLNPSSLTLCPSLKPVADQSDTDCCSLHHSSVGGDENCVHCWDQSLRFPIVHKEDICNGTRVRVLKKCRGSVERIKRSSGMKGLDEYVKDWVARKVESGVPPHKCCLPFLVGAPRLVECRVCQNLVYPGEELLCSVRGCEGVYHLICAKKSLGLSSLRKFKCPQHACYICKQKLHWRCVRCTIASHDKCAAFPEHVVHLNDQLRQAICWRHPTDWRLQKAG